MARDEKLLDFQVRAQVRIRRRDKVYEWRDIGATPEQLRFAVAALQQDFEALQGLSEVIRALGMIVPVEEAPASPEELAFRLDLTPELLALVPDAESFDDDERDLILNPSMFLQTTSALPAPVAGRVHVEPAPSSGPETFSKDLPVLWVEAPRTKVVFPVWFGGPWGELVEEVALGRRDFQSVPRDVRAVLRAAAIVVRRADLEAPYLAPVPEVKVTALPKILPAAFTAALRRHYRTLREHGFFEPDERQVRQKRSGVYRDLVAMFVQHQVGQVLERSIGVACKPSYTWYMLYTEGAELVRHVDRPQCRWNVSLCIDDQHGLEAGQWPLEFDVDGSVRAVDLAGGDGVLYSGTETPHWRRPLPAGHAVGNLFLHFVDPSFTGATY